MNDDIHSEQETTQKELRGLRGITYFTGQIVQCINDVEGAERREAIHILNCVISMYRDFENAESQSPRGRRAKKLTVVK
jgi:hypothetical protein